MLRETSSLILLGSRRVPYAIRFSSTSRRSKIKVNASGVQVVLPRHASESHAAELLRDNARWVLDQLAFVRRIGSLRRKPAPLAAHSVFIRGRRTSLEFVEEDSSRTFGIVEERAGVLRVRMPKANPPDPSKALEAWLRRQARQDIEARLAQRAAEMRQQPGRIYVMGQRTKWGGCSRRHNLSFNWRLVMAPPAVLDYVVVHELAHLAEPHHSTKFWLIVRSHCPDLAHHKAWLRDHQALLMQAVAPHP